MLALRSSSCGLSNGRLGLGTGQVGTASLGVLGVVVGDGGLDGVLSQHRAVELDGGQAQLLGDLSVLDLAGIVEAHAAHELGEVAAGGDGGAAAERLELDIGDAVCLGVDSDLQLHHVATSRGADEAGADVEILLVHGTDISGPRVVVEDLFVVGPPGIYGDGWEGLSGEGGDGRASDGGNAPGGNGETPGEHFGCFR